MHCSLSVGFIISIWMNLLLLNCVNPENMLIGSSCSRLKNEIGCFKEHSWASYEIQSFKKSAIMLCWCRWWWWYDNDDDDDYDMMMMMMMKTVGMSCPEKHNHATLRLGTTWVENIMYTTWAEKKKTFITAGTFEWRWLLSTTKILNILFIGIHLIKVIC